MAKNNVDGVFSAVFVLGQLAPEVRGTTGPRALRRSHSKGISKRQS